MNLDVSRYPLLLDPKDKAPVGCLPRKCTCGFFNNDPLFDRQQAADYIGLTNKHTLSVWHSTKRYDIERIKVGKAVRYRKSTLDQFLISRLRR